MSTAVRIVRYVYLGLAWLFVVGIFAQVFFVGLTLFAGYGMMPLHVGVGHMIGVLVLLMVILMYVGKLPRKTKITVWALFVTYVFQAEVFAGIRDIMPLPAAFHPVLALVVFWLAMTLALEARSFTRQEASAA